MSVFLGLTCFLLMGVLVLIAFVLEQFDLLTYKIQRIFAFAFITLAFMMFIFGGIIIGSAAYKDFVVQNGL